MRILDRYILKEFLKYFLGAIFSLLVIIIIAEIFELMDIILINKVLFTVAGGYFLYQVPYWITQVAPVACLIGVLFSIGQLVHYNELTAMKASGLNLFRIIIPLILFGLFTSLFFIFINDTVVPYSSQKAQKFRQEGIYLRPPDSQITRENIIFYGSNRQIYKIKLFNGKDNTMQEIFIDKFNNNSVLTSRLYSKMAVWKNGQWIFYNGIFREFDQNGNISKTEKFNEKTIWTGEIPQDFAKIEKKTSEMNYKELKKYIKKLENNGFISHREKVDLYMKIAFPFANFIILLLGIPFAFFGGHSKKAIGIGIAILISFSYWGLIEIGHALGSNGILHPFLAAWIVNIIFFIIAGILIFKVKK